MLKYIGGGGGGQKRPKLCLRNISMVPKDDVVDSSSVLSSFLTWKKKDR